MSNKNGSGWVTKATRYALYHRDGFRCAYCGRSPTEHGAMLTLDHIEERANGGKHAPDNLITVCFECNSSRQDRGNRAFFASLRERAIDTAKVSARISRLRAKKVDVRLGGRLWRTAQAAVAACKTGMGRLVHAAKASSEEE